MDSRVIIECPHCSTTNEVVVHELGNEDEVVKCSNCGHALSTVSKLHAKIAQEAAGIGPGELADDHVPLGGPPFGSTT